MFPWTTLLFFALLTTPANAQSTMDRLEKLAADGQIQEDAAVKASSEITIHAPPEIAWHLLTDINNWPKWQSTISAAKSPGIGNCFCMDQRRHANQILHRTRSSGHSTGMDRNRIQGTSYSRLESATFTRRRHTRQNHRVYGRFYAEALVLLQRSCEVTASLA
jgi:polyketide cyclase/dehydrase/lipid transport protein